MINFYDIQRGFDEWAAKPHNAKWVRKIDGTPIGNDIVCCIWNAIRDQVVREAVAAETASPSELEARCEALEKVIRDNWMGDYWRAVSHKDANEVRTALANGGRADATPPATDERKEGGE